MHLILHIGMGKTGTSSLQQALQADRAGLQAQGARYLGMWFDVIDPRYKGVLGLRDFLTGPRDTVAEGARVMVARMREIQARDGTQTFILSNEDFYGRIEHLDPFLEVLKQELRLSIVMYVRNLHSWLPSAYVQWAVRHKVQAGPTKSFAEDVPRLVRTYRTIRTWKDRHGDHLIIRPFDKSVDVISDFSGVIGKKITPPPTRFLERAEDTEVLLRALFNNRYEGEVFPDRFNRMVFNPGRGAVPSIDQALADYLDFRLPEAALAEERAFLETLSEEIGIDVLGQPGAAPAPVRRDEIEPRLIDHLVEITLHQSTLLQRLERRLKALEDKAEDQA